MNGAGNGCATELDALLALELDAQEKRRPALRRDSARTIPRWRTSCDSL